MARNNKLIVALLLPLLVIALGIARAEYHLAHARVWSFEVTGYDPRDLLRGQYLNYRLVLDEGPAALSCNDSDPDCCLCLTDSGEGAVPKLQRMTIGMAAEQQCNGMLQTRYLSELQHYYIPENQASKVTQRLRDAAAKHDARLLLAIDAFGKPQVQALLVGGERIEKQQP